MLNITAVPARAQFLDDDGNPLSGGRVSYYEAGTNTLKEVYTDRDGTASALNPHILNAGGFVRAGGVWYGEGFYKVVVEKAVGLPAAGEEAENISVVDALGEYEGTYSHYGEDENGDYIWRGVDVGRTDFYISRYVDSGLSYYGLFLGPIPFAAPAIAYRLVSTGLVGDWSRAGMAVGYPSYEVFWTQDDIAGADVPDPTNSAGYIADIQTLRGLDSTEFGVAYVRGYYDEGDGGEGFFWFNDVDTSADNGGTIIAPLGNPAIGRWNRLVEQEYITPALFGSIAGSSLVVGSNWTQMVTWCKNNSVTKYIRVPKGVYKINANVTINGDISVRFDAGAQCTSTIACTLAISCSDCVIEGKSNVATGLVVLSFNPANTERFFRPEWDNCYANGVNDDWDAFKRIASNSVGREVRIGSQFALIGPSGGDTNTIDNLVFELGGKLLNKYPDRITNILSFREEGRLEGIFGGDAPKGIRSFRDTFMARWLDLDYNAITSANLINLVECATAGGSNRAKIVWDAKISYTIPDDFSISVNTYLGYTDWEIVQGSTIRYNGTLSIPTLICGNGGLDPNSTGSLVVGSAINPLWWGAVPNTQNTSFIARNAVALKMALQCAAASYPTELNGGNAPYAVNAQVKIALVDSYGSIKVKSLSLAGVGDFGSTYLLESDLDGVHEITDLNIAGSALHSIRLTKTSDTSLLIENSSFTGYVQHLGTGALSIVDSLFVGGVSCPDCTETTFQGNRASSVEVYINGVNGIITGNSFTDCKLSVIDPETFIVNGNNFVSRHSQSYLSLVGRSAGFIVNGLIATNNIFTSSITIFNAIQLTNIAAMGHTAKITDNSAIGTVFVHSTSVKVRYTHHVEYTTYLYFSAIVSIADKYILPFGTVPIRMTSQLVGLSVDEYLRAKVQIVPALSQAYIRGLFEVNPSALPEIATAWYLDGVPEQYDTYDVFFDITLSDVTTNVSI